MIFFNKTLLHAPQFLTEKRSIFQFLTLGAIVAILFWMFYKPIGITGSKNGLWGESMPLYSAILVCAGITIIVLSRVLLYIVIKRVSMKISGYLTWLICEWIIIIAALTFLAQSINSNSTLSLSIIFGRVTIFVSVWLIIPYSFSILLFQIRERNMEISALKAMLNEQQTKPEIRPQIDEMMNFYDKSGHLVFGTQKKNILYIAANDNYTNIYYINDGNVDCYIHHSSMKQVEDAYVSHGLLRCHRGYLVNVQNVKLLKRENDGLILELYQTDTVLPVSKTYTDSVTHYFASSPNAS